MLSELSELTDLMLWEKNQKLLRLQRDFATSQFLNKGIFLGELLLVQPSVEVVGGKRGN